MEEQVLQVEMEQVVVQEFEVDQLKLVVQVVVEELEVLFG